MNFQVSLPFLLPLFKATPSEESPIPFSYSRKTQNTQTTRSWLPPLPLATQITLSSFFCFFLPHAIVVTARHVMDFAEVANSPRQEWTVKVRWKACYSTPFVIAQKGLKSIPKERGVKNAPGCVQIS